MNAGVLVGVVVSVIIGVVGLQIVNDVITNANFSGLLATVTNNIPILLAVGLMVVAVGWAFLRS